MKYYASVSWGKDSTEMLNGLIDGNYPLNEAVFYDTGMEFQAIYDTRDMMLPKLNKHGIKYTELSPENPMIYDMLERPKVKRSGECVYGDGWCGGPCRWGTFKKQEALNKYMGDNITYIGLAADEPIRLAELEPHKKAPLAEWGMTEGEALMRSYKRGYEWMENGKPLYALLDRVSCWCCRNKNLKELRNIYRFLPEYWERLRNLQARISEPMKGKGKSVFELEARFKSELHIERMRK